MTPWAWGSDHVILDYVFLILSFDTRSQKVQALPHCVIETTLDLLIFLSPHLLLSPLPGICNTSDYNIVLKLWKRYPAVFRILSFPTIPKDHTFPYFLFCWELWTSLFTVAKGPFPHSQDSWASGPLNRKALSCLSKLSRVCRRGDYTRVSGQWDASG